MNPHGREAPVYFLLHIPKTAGQTIQLHLAEHCAPGAFWQPRRRLWRFGRVGDVPGDLGRVRVVGGHDVAHSLEARFPGREIRRVVLLRDPVGLQLSLYNYRMMNYLAKGLGTYSFGLHLAALPRDYMTHLLLIRWLELPRAVVMAMSAARKYEILNRMLAGFWFVGAYTDCDRLIAAIAADLGVPPRAAPRNTAAEWGKRVEWRPLTEAELTAADRAAILAHNPIDTALWESWHAAGFAAAQVRPRPLDPQCKSDFLAHEILRPGFVFARLCRRYGMLLRRGAGGIVRGDRARDAGRWDLAARHYRRALERMPKAPAIWVQYGHALKALGELPAAEAAYRRSLALDPGAADTWLQLGHALKLQGRLAEAAEAYAECLARDPASPHAQNELAALGWTSAQITAALGIGAPAVS